ncbi:MAG: alpha/beta hydrolase [Paraglaciecola sp.]|uniref:alpha/beta hydrolase n=1 Tax=Paraglaciecola sp. TaxID=1920173 RepID=UPI00329A3892
MLNLKIPLMAWFCLSCLSPIVHGYEVDDSYTVTSAYAKYHKQYPHIRLVDVQPAGKIRFDRVYANINGRELHADLFHPTLEQGQQPLATIVMIHGGGWNSGNKSLFYPLASAMAQRGYLAVTVEYRLAPEAQYPAGLRDINAAIVWLKQQSVSLNINPDKLVLLGGSSGGHMAALLANSADEPLFHADKSITVSTQVKAAIDIDGVLDVSQGDGLKHEDKNGNANSAMGKWLGGNFAQQTERWKAVSTALRINQTSPPLLFLSSGQMRFAAGHELVFAKLSQLGIAHEMVNFAPAPHSFWLFHPWFNRVVDKVDQFILENVVQIQAPIQSQ